MEGNIVALVMKYCQDLHVTHTKCTSRNARTDGEFGEPGHRNTVHVIMNGGPIVPRSFEQHENHVLSAQRSGRRVL